MKWTSEEDKILAETILTFMKYRKSVNDGIMDALKRLPNRTIEGCRGRWHSNLRYTYKDEIEKIKNKLSVSWSEREDRTLVNVLSENFKMGKNIKEACRYASDALQAIGYSRTQLACVARWKEIKYDYPHIIEPTKKAYR